MLAMCIWKKLKKRDGGGGGSGEVTPAAIMGLEVEASSLLGLGLEVEAGGKRRAVNVCARACVNTGGWVDKWGGWMGGMRVDGWTSGVDGWAACGRMDG